MTHYSQQCIFSNFKPESVEKYNFQYSKFSEKVEFIKTKAKVIGDLEKRNCSWGEFSKANLLSIINSEGEENFNENTNKFLRNLYVRGITIGRGFNYTDKINFENNPKIKDLKDDFDSNYVLITTGEFSAFYDKFTQKIVRTVNLILQEIETLYYTSDKGEECSYIYLNRENECFDKVNILTGDVIISYAVASENSDDYSYKITEIIKDDKRLLIAVNNKGKLRSWDFETGDIIEKEVKLEIDENINCIKFSHALNRIAIVLGQSNSLLILEVKGFKKFKQIYGEEIYDINITTDEKRGIFLTNKRLKSISLETGIIGRISPPMNYEITSYCYGKEQIIIANAKNRIFLYDENSMIVDKLLFFWR